MGGMVLEVSCISGTGASTTMPGSTGPSSTGSPSDQGANRASSSTSGTSPTSSGPHTSSSPARAPHGAHLFWLQKQYTHKGLSGAAVLAQALQALLEDPPEYDSQAAAAELQARGVSTPPGATPLQLGPLPLSLVEDMLRHR